MENKNQIQGVNSKHVRHIKPLLLMGIKGSFGSERQHPLKFDCNSTDLLKCLTSS